MTRMIFVFIFHSPESSGVFKLLGVHNAHEYSVGFLGCPCHLAKVYLRVYLGIKRWLAARIMPVAIYLQQLQLAGAGGGLGTIAHV